MGGSNILFKDPLVKIGSNMEFVQSFYPKININSRKLCLTLPYGELMLRLNLL